MNVSSPQPTIIQAMNFIHEHCCIETFNVPAVAQHCGISRRVLERKFRAQMNTSPLNEIIKTRITVAKHYLLESNRSVTDISAIVGFADVKSLRLHFLRIEGTTPGKWRRARKSQTPLESVDQSTHS